MGDEGGALPLLGKIFKLLLARFHFCDWRRTTVRTIRKIAETASNRTRMEADILTFHHHEGAYRRATSAEHGFLTATEQSVIGFGNRDGTDRGPAEQGWGV